MYEHIRSTREAGVGRIVLARPERRNAMSLDLMAEVVDALEALGADAAVQVIVIEGEGPAFSAGHDLKELLGREPGFYDDLFRSSTTMMETIHRVPQPVIAKVHGVATAAGCQLVASCDLVVAAETAVFATPGVKIGLFCSTPMVPISRAVGRKRAMEMLLTGEPVSATTAQAWGLVNRVVPAAELDGAVDELIAQITRYSPAVIGLGKDAFYTQIELDEHRAYEFAAGIMATNARDGDAQEGMGAFLEKRAPQWATSRPDEAAG
jgi:enoyl-CoA hydratase/carnithine racemase